MHQFSIEENTYTAHSNASETNSLHIRVESTIIFALNTLHNNTTSENKELSHIMAESTIIFALENLRNNNTFETHSLHNKLGSITMSACGMSNTTF